ncbi:uncharacterized protein LOC113004804 isoform X2 [Solenopsis invicta]|uniref:uncharacterized protein LOC113004804 isoform X2 n=1 Tax=Solenopsis invicta TaxID=13686 RepID=UPI00193DDAA1|nr:uncharacterized protein LOC113004804 isoform X2 [Solenopsis invicta]
MANVPPAGRGSRFNPYSKEEVRREVGRGNRRRSMSLRSQDSNEAGQEDEDFAAEESDVEIMDVQKCAKILGIESVETSNLKSSVIQSEPVVTKEKCSETMDKTVKGGKGHAGISQEVNMFTDCEGIEKREQVKDRSINMKCDKITKQDTFSRGVITDWPYEIPELWENIVDKKDIFRIEKMKKRVWDQGTKKFQTQFINNFIITLKGKSKDRIKIFDNLNIGLRIRPYVAPVIQCFNCFRFGHFKHQCKNEARCIVCGDNMHGDCNKPEACRNCEGAHRSTKRSCPVALRNKEIKTIMAYNNVTFFEAERLLKLSFANQNMTNYDRYTNPSAWPRIGHNNKERENETEIKITEFSRNTNNGNNTKENKTTANHQVNYRTYYKDIERDREEEERRRQERREIEERERRRQERREREREKQE